MTTTCIVLCGGKNSRWGGYQNTPRKHLVEIEGEILLNRTLRMIANYHPSRTVVVINDGDLDIYASKLLISPEFYLIAPPCSDHTEAYKLLSSKELWNHAGRTIILLGDVWFSEEAFRKIFDHHAHDWTAFGRSGANMLTGCPYGELFAQSFTSCEEHGENLNLLDAMYRNGTCTRGASEWAHYCLMIGADPNIHAVSSRFVEINDFTEDFDFPVDYDSWILGRASRRAMEFNYDSWIYGRTLKKSWMNWRT